MYKYKYIYIYIYIYDILWLNNHQLLISWNIFCHLFYFIGDLVDGLLVAGNQLAELDAYSANDSASQAAFLTGATRKYGAKAGQMTHAIVLHMNFWDLRVGMIWI